MGTYRPIYRFTLSFEHNPGRIRKCKETPIATIGLQEDLNSKLAINFKLAYGYIGPTKVCPIY